MIRTATVAVFVSVVLMCMLGAAVPSAAQSSDQPITETLHVDDSSYQEFRGKVGKWVSLSATKTIAYYIRLFSSTPEEVSGANKDFPSGFKYAFIPFGKEYIEGLEQSGITRAILNCKSDQFIWPVSEKITISSVLGFRGRNFHTGIDIPAEKGAVVRAAMEGQVIDVRYEGGYGHVIDIQHRNSFVTRYAHNTVNLVKNGDFVKKGQIIALAGSTGRSTGSHCHFEIRCNSIPLDPMDFLPDAEKIPAVQNMKSWKFRRK